jgi:hypothetical protein
MARCAYCQTETELYDGPSPICVQCAETSSAKRLAKAKLFQDLHEATRRAEAATDAFAALTAGIPSGMPHQDGTQRIYDASHELNAARDEMLKAHNRLNGFLTTGIVPET